MPNLVKKPWYSEGKTFIRKVDHWVSRRNPPSEIGEESDWLGWDGWVRTDGSHRATRDTTHAA